MCQSIYLYWPCTHYRRIFFIFFSFIHFWFFCAIKITQNQGKFFNFRFQLKMSCSYWIRGKLQCPKVSKSRPKGEKIFLSNLCDFIVSTAHCFHQNTQLMVTSFLFCLQYTQTTHSPELTFDITRAMWLAMWHTTGVCFITSFNRICHCRYFFVRLWNN